MSLAAFACVAILADSARGQVAGRRATQAEIDGWNIDVAPDGAGLPPGRGTVAEGRAVFQQHCASCHGAEGESGPAPVLVGGRGSLTSPRKLRTVGSYWPYATTVFDYVRRAMPFDAPGSLSAPQIYSVTAFLLFRNGLVQGDAVMDSATLPQVRMPNRDGFRSVWRGD